MRTFACAGLFAMMCAASAPAQVTLLSSTLEEKELAAGEVYNGVIRVRNESDTPQEVKLYQTDYAFSADGSTAYDPAGSMRRSNAKWIEVSPARMLVPPHGEAVARYTVTLPDSGLSGSYWSMIMVEAISPGNPESSLTGGNSRRAEVGVQTLIRYGIQIATHVRGEAPRDARIENALVSKHEEGKRSLQFDLINTGERAYRPQVTVQLIDSEGKQLAELKAERGLVYPGSSIRQRFELPAGLRGEHRVVVLADTGGNELLGAQFRLSF